MARDVTAKLAAGEELDEDDIRYLLDRGRGQELVDAGYEAAVTTYVDAGNFGTPTGPLMQTGPAYEMPNQVSAMGPGVFLTEEQLSGLTNDSLDEIAEAMGVEVPSKKADKVAALSGGTASASSEEEEAEEEEG